MQQGNFHGPGQATAKAKASVVYSAGAVRLNAEAEGHAASSAMASFTTVQGDALNPVRVHAVAKAEANGGSR